jgi:hypothetical protein
LGAAAGVRRSQPAGNQAAVRSVICQSV